MQLHDFTSTRARKLKIDLSFCLTAHETVWCVFYGCGLEDKAINRRPEAKIEKKGVVKFSVISYSRKIIIIR